MNRKIVSFALMLTLFINLFAFYSDSNEAIKVLYNNKQITYSSSYGYPFIDENNRTQVPFRRTMEYLGAKISWDEVTRTATATLNSIQVDIPIGENYILKDGSKIQNDTISVIIGNRTYLPIRIVLEAFGFDVNWDQSNLTVLITSQELPSFTLIPSSYDLRDSKRITPVRNQFDTGACWAFAALGAIESSLAPTEIFNFSEDHISLGHGFNLSQAKGGNYMIALSYLTRWSGPVSEAEDPFNDGKKNPDAKVLKHLQEAQFIPSKDYTGIKLAIMKYGGVQTSIHATDLSFTVSTSYYSAEKGTYYYNRTKDVNHDVVLVGWDDHYSRENFNTKPLRNGAFIAKNSYGTAFGEEGYFYISYEDSNIGKQNIVYTRIDPTNNYDNIYQADWLGNIGQIGYGEKVAYFANVYESDKAEKLKAVSFYAVDPGTSYEVFVVKNYTGKSDLNSRTSIKSGKVDYAGYYTVDLNSDLMVNGKFAVIVKVTAVTSKYPVAAEYKKDVSWVSSVDLTDGVGYISYDGSNWDDTETLLNANVCLKAFTDNIF